MSRTFMDLAGRPTHRTTLEIVKNSEGTYDLLINGDLAHNHVEQQWLNEELCVRYGFCGEEYEAIVQKVQTLGRASVVVY